MEKSFKEMLGKLPDDVKKSLANLKLNEVVETMYKSGFIDAMTIVTKAIEEETKDY